MSSNQAAYAYEGLQGQTGSDTTLQTQQQGGAQQQLGQAASGAQHQAPYYNYQQQRFGNFYDTNASYNYPNQQQQLYMNSQQQHAAAVAGAAQQSPYSQYGSQTANSPSKDAKKSSGSSSTAVSSTSAGGAGSGAAPLLYQSSAPQPYPGSTGFNNQSIGAPNANPGNWIGVGRPLMNQTPAKPRITTTFWEDENTVCYQVEARGISVSRREDSNFINGTKLLNVTGMTRGRRDGILKTEKTRYVVKIGAMNLKGVWIPFERAFELARNEGIADSLFPLFVRDIKSFFLNGGGNATYIPHADGGIAGSQAATATASTATAAALPLGQQQATYNYNYATPVATLTPQTTSENGAGASETAATTAAAAGDSQQSSATMYQQQYPQYGYAAYNQYQYPVNSNNQQYLYYPYQAGQPVPGQQPGAQGQQSSGAGSGTGASGAVSDLKKEKSEH